MLQLTVTLQCEEKISEEHKPHCKKEIANQSLSKYHEVCYNLKYSQLILPIPMHVTPAFNTNIGIFYPSFYVHLVQINNYLNNVKL